ncbi:MAG: hypothetical protein ACM34K_05120 [Bacillota bacterium]
MIGKLFDLKFNLSYLSFMNEHDFSSRNYAINIQMESLNPMEETVTFDTLIRVFNKFKTSFKNFIEIEFLRTAYFREILKIKPRALEDMKHGTELAIVRINIEELFISIAPDLSEDEEPLFTDELLCWKKEKFSEFKQKVIFCNYHDPFSIEKIMTSYELTERIKIYKPIFDVISYDKAYKINILGPSNKLIGMFIPPHDVIRKKLLSPVKIQKKEKEE